MLDQPGFNFQLASLTQLNLIDELRELGVAEFIALPQVSHQGSLKSTTDKLLISLLLSGISPGEQGLRQNNHSY
jgi:hypothetical protein